MANLCTITYSSFPSTVDWPGIKSTGFSFRQNSGRDSKKWLAQRTIPFVRELSSVVRTGTRVVQVSFSALVGKECVITPMTPFANRPIGGTCCGAGYGFHLPPMPAYYR